MAAGTHQETGLWPEGRDLRDAGRVLNCVRHGAEEKTQGIQAGDSLVSIAKESMAPDSSTLAWKIPWTEEPGGLQSMGLRRVGHNFPFFHFSLSCIGEGNGSPLQCSCLENPRDGGAWWAAVYGVAQSQTRLKRLSSSSSGEG